MMNETYQLVEREILNNVIAFSRLEMMRSIKSGQ